MGLLPEPERLGNGYREYRLRDAVALAQVRRLAELGMSLGARAHALYARLDELAGAEPGDPRIDPLARDLAALLPEAMAAALAASVEDPGSAHWLAMLSTELPVAQAEVFRRLAVVVKERT